MIADALDRPHRDRATALREAIARLETSRLPEDRERLATYRRELSRLTEGGDDA